MTPLPLLLVAAALLTPASPRFRGDRYISEYDDRRYYCRDRYGYVGDCYGSSYRADRDYGYDRLSRGRNMGNGYYNLVGGRHAELVCDFPGSGRLSNIAWMKVQDYDRRSSRYRDRDGRSYSYRNYRYSRYRDYDRDRRSFDDWYTNDDYSTSTRVSSRGSKSTLYIRDYQPSDYGRYRCFATQPDRYGYDDHTVYMDVQFNPGRRGYK